MRLALNNNIKIKLIYIFLAIVLITMALILTKKNKLILINDKTHKKIASYSFKNNNLFSIEFIHSVNKNKIIEFYKFDNKKNIILYKTIYYSFGAGVETELENDEILTYGDDGSMIISNINKKIDDLVYIVGTVYSHILKINNEEIVLDKIFGKNTHIKFIIK